ncbi:sodium pump decarboxylases, gamma subunit [Tessaracoccus bendigoensis DSM 12906]|uniref:Sodium pump decarboxylases, gamma subunit n=1 Tax=Tessaracoccus bendigoensis DSM 12906 TaxID=1123357 RepID=A0A1M6K069_9ACTN|nr:OadG family transporter subunit [Tessaracoccus bendigoensis]SHJ52330.1 sodium pump decarboxylases, gamma subunit [Tessaracoccus bendigoensis DSM 12906]
MDDLLWGLTMMGLGMGSVFALLLVLMGLLILIGRLDTRRSLAPEPAPSPQAEEPDAPTAGVRILADGLTEDQVAAIAVAVVTHAAQRRRQAAPETRAFAPGSQLFANRWVSVGRSRRNTPRPRR